MRAGLVRDLGAELRRMRGPGSLTTADVNDVELATRFRGELDDPLDRLHLRDDRARPQVTHGAGPPLAYHLRRQTCGDRVVLRVYGHHDAQFRSDLHPAVEGEVI